MKRCAIQIAIAVLIFIAPFATRAQSPQTATLPHLRFAVASIRPSDPAKGPRDAHTSIRGDRLDVEAATVGDILDMLNGFQLFKVTGGPAWMRTDRYDIHAKADSAIPDGERNDAIMALLRERFQLTTHRETREIATAVLLASKRPAGLKPAAEGETYSIHFTRNDPTFTAMPISGITNYLSQMWGMPVVDQTGIEGSFDFSFQASAVDALPGEGWGDRIRTAMLAFGFKIETRNVPMEITVVDGCERPSEN